jgi:hypothetical protein
MKIKFVKNMFKILKYFWRHLKLLFCLKKKLDMDNHLYTE